MAIQIIGNSSTQIIADTVFITAEPTANDQVVTKSYVDVRADKNYIHNQMTSSAVWNIQHNLGKKPAITVVDTAESVVIGEVDYVDNDNVVLTFAFPFSGMAYLN